MALPPATFEDFKNSGAAGIIKRLCITYETGQVFEKLNEKFNLTLIKETKYFEGGRVISMISKLINAPPLEIRQEYTFQFGDIFYVRYMNPSLASCNVIYIKVPNQKILNQIKSELDIWTKTTPLLRYVQSGEMPFSCPSKVGAILKKYQSVTPVKKAMWDCQRELIDSGYEGNARF
jgi:hypothetical protein